MSKTGPVRSIDFSQYPDGTAEVFCALSKIGSHPGAKRSEIAELTALSKSQVRYRLDRLREDGIVKEQTDREQSNDIHRYRLVTKYFQAGQNSQYCMELLGEIPEDINSEQLMTLIDEMRFMRDKIENLREVVFND